MLSRALVLAMTEPKAIADFLQLIHRDLGDLCVSAVESY